MATVYKDGEYVTLRTNKGVYLIGYNNILAFKPHPTKGDKYSLYIDQGAYDARCFDFISRFCGRTDIVERVEKGEFKVKPLQNLI